MYYNVEQYILILYYVKSTIMGFIDSIKGFLGLTPKPAATTAPTASQPLWQQQGFRSQDEYDLNNGIVTSTGQYDNPVYGNNPIPATDNATPQLRTYHDMNRTVTPPVIKNPAPAPVSTVPAAPVLPDRSNSIRSNEAALAGADIQKTSGLSSIQETLNKLLGRYGEEATANTANYTENSNTNKSNLQRNTQSALVNAAEGRRGLFGILQSLGALSGSGVNLANRAVQKGANDDITGANDTFGENQTALDTSIGTFNDADKKRRDDAERNAENTRIDLENQVLGNKQKIYSNLADDYSQEGKADQARKYADLVASLFPEIARTSVPKSEIAYSGATFNPASLNKYVGGDASTQVRTQAPTAPGLLPGLVALTPAQRRERED